MEISKSISFITEDPRWQQKLMIGTGVIIGSAVLSVVFIGIIGFIIFAGYCVRLLQNVRDGVPYPLPEWDQWGEDLARGFKLIIATLVWGLPMLILVIPSIIGSAMTESRSDGAQFMGSMLLICGSCLTMIYGLLLAAVTPGISIAFAKDEQITSALQFRQIPPDSRLDTSQHRPSPGCNACLYRSQYRARPYRQYRWRPALCRRLDHHHPAGVSAYVTLPVSPLWAVGL
jgi:hypothetical protein